MTSLNATSIAQKDAISELGVILESEMKLLSERTQVKDAINLWISRYGLDGTYGADRRGRRVGAELMDRETATAVQVNSIIGGPWVFMKTCGECGKESWNIVEIGEPADYGSQTAYLCRDCLVSAIKMIDEQAI